MVAQLKHVMDITYKTETKLVLQPLYFSELLELLDPFREVKSEVALGLLKPFELRRIMALTDIRERLYWSHCYRNTDGLNITVEDAREFMGVSGKLFDIEITMDELFNLTVITACRFARLRSEISGNHRAIYSSNRCGQRMDEFDKHWESPIGEDLRIMLSVDSEKVGRNEAFNEATYELRKLDLPNEVYHKLHAKLAVDTIGIVNPKMIEEKVQTVVDSIKKRLDAKQK
jgi:hypothetical protein